MKMTITIFGMLWGNYSSVNKLDDNKISLITKQDLYDRIFGINSDGLPDIISVGTGRNSKCISSVINYIDSLNPDIYVDYIDDIKLNFTKSRPKIVILFDILNRRIIYNGNIIDVTFGDVDESIINAYVGREFIVNGYRKVYKNIGEIETTFNLDIPPVCKYFSDNTHSVNNYFRDINPFLKIAFINIAKRLALEYIMQYRDNPTLSVEHKKDNKSELLEIIDSLQLQINGLKEYIKNM